MKKTLVLSVLFAARLMMADAQVVMQPAIQPQCVCVAQQKPRCPLRTIAISTITSALTTIAMFVTVVKLYNE